MKETSQKNQHKRWKVKMKKQVILEKTHIKNFCSQKLIVPWDYAKDNTNYFKVVFEVDTENLPSLASKNCQIRQKSDREQRCKHELKTNPNRIFRSYLLAGSCWLFWNYDLFYRTKKNMERTLCEASPNYRSNIPVLWKMYNWLMLNPKSSEANGTINWKNER